MATAFTQHERECIYNSLHQAALHFAATIGMRRTTVDELAGQAGISKGAFYSFFDSKEQLFLSMVERLHEEMYGQAEKVFEENTALPLHERAMKAIYELCRIARKYEIVPFMQEELPLLLRKIPQASLKENYISDRERIHRLLQKTGVELKTTLDVACTTVHMLLLTLSFRREAGEHFDEAMQVIVAGACDQVFA